MGAANSSDASFTISMHLQLRPLELKDLHDDFKMLLQQLTDGGAGVVDENFFRVALEHAQLATNHHMIVLEERTTKRLVAGGTVVIEPKFIHQCGQVGHIEDVVVDYALRGKGLGRRLVKRLSDISREKGCYKVILDCAEHSVGFYEKCGFKRKEVMMAQYFDIASADGPSLSALLEPRDLGDGLVVRQLQVADFGSTFLSLLAQLTEVGKIEESSFRERVEMLQNAKLGDLGSQYIIVIETGGSIVAAGTLILEQKFINKAGLAGHVEDIVVDSSVRGKGLGLKIISALCSIAKAAGCYKVVLDCGEHNIGFYEKCGFARKEVQMVQYF